MLGKKFKDAYNEWAGTSSRSHEGAGKYYESAWHMMEAINETFARIGYNRHSIDYTLYICEDYGFNHGLADSTYEPGEARHRRQVVATFLRELAAKIESGEC